MTVERRDAGRWKHEGRKDGSENQRECPEGLASGGISRVQLAWLTPNVGPTDLGTRQRVAPLDRAELEQWFGGVKDGGGQRLTQWDDLHERGLVRVRGQGYGCGCCDGFEDVFFHRVIIDCLNYVPSVAPSGAAFNPSWHLNLTRRSRNQEFG